MLLALLAAGLLAAPSASSEEIARLRIEARAMDLSHSPEVKRFREAYVARRRAGKVPRAGGNTTGMTVSDIGRVTVMRDATGDSWEAGDSIDDVFEGTEDTITAFFEAHPDSDADFVVIIQDWVNLGFAGAFYLPLENDVEGIGYQYSHAAELFDDDPSTPIEGFLWLNGVQLLASDLFVGILWGQELGHRWGAFVNVDTGSGLDDSILGRQEAHWSWYLDTDWSWMEGNDWLDNGDGTWTTNLATYDTVPSHYSPLDLYLMGLVGTADVPSFVQLLPSGQGPDPGEAPAGFTGESATITATPRVLTIQDVLRAEGPRVPSVEASPKAWDLAIVYVLRQDDRATAEDLVLLEGILDELLSRWDADTGGRASVSFGATGTPNEPPVLAAIDGPSRVRAGRAARFDASAATDPEGQPLTFSWRWDAGDRDVDFEAGEAEQAHTFQRQGARTIEVSVRDAGGAETIVSFELEVEPGSGSGCGCALSTRPPARSAGMLGLACLLVLAWARRRAPYSADGNAACCASASPSRTGASATVHRSAGAS